MILMAKQSTKQLIDSNQGQVACNQSVKKNSNIDLLCLADESNNNQVVRQEILKIAKLLAQVAVDNYVQAAINASQNL